MSPAWRVAHSLDDLANEVNARWPGRSRISDGTLGDPAHAARTSDHNPDAAGIVRARDITEWDPGTPNVEADDVAEVIAETIRARRDPRVKYVIWRGRMFSSYAKGNRAAWEWGPYTGANGHFAHVHVSVLPGAQGDASGPWGLHPHHPSEEDDMPLTTDDLAAIGRLIDQKLGAHGMSVVAAVDKADDGEHADIGGWARRTYAWVRAAVEILFPDKAKDVAERAGVIERAERKKATG